MFLVVVPPIVRPEFYSYRTLASSFRVQIGFPVDDTTSEDNWSLRDWSLKDKDNVIVQSGQVNAKDNSFESYVDLSGLQRNTIYTLTIDNKEFGLSSAVIVTFSTMSQLEIANEKTIIDEPIQLYGDLTLSGKKLRFPSNWEVTRKLGSGVFKRKSNGKYGVYQPSCIFTRHRDVSSVLFTPIAGLPEVSIPVYQLATIIKTGSYSYSISPATKLRVVFKYGDTQKDITTTEKVTKLNLQELDSEVNGIVQVQISSVFG